MKRIVLIILILYSNNLLSRTISWADKVIGFSSEESSKKGSAKQILGEPSILPNYGFSPCGWTPKLYTMKTEWIKVGFSNPIYVEQIAINENCYPGAISQIIIFDSLDQGFQVYGNNRSEPESINGRMFNLFIEKTNFRVKALKIELNLLNYIEKYQIDAIAISESRDSIKVEINKIKDEEKVVRERLENNVNSNYAELAPIISQDGKLLIFTRDGHPENSGINKKQDIWYSEVNQNGEFNKAVNFGSPINNNNVNFAISISTDMNTLFLGNKYLPDGVMKQGFSMSYRNGNTWTFPDSIVINNYSNLKNSGSYCMAGNGKVLLLAIQRNDSYGDNDIYVSFLGDANVWSEPENLGITINTSDEEISPFLASDGVTLYYSTAGKPGYGLHDMFVTKRLDSTWKNWSEPLNLGDKVNSDGWDAYYTVTAKGDYAYFVSNAKADGREDIYRIKLPEQAKPQAVVLISGKVINQKTNNPLEASIIYEILPGGKSAGVARSNPENGEYKIALPAGFNYGFLAKANDFISVNENIDLTNADKYMEISKDLFLVPVEKGQHIRINNIFFEYNKFELLEQSFSELDRIAEFLRSNPTVMISIAGHTDNIGTIQFNSNLSIERATSVRNYLIKSGIANNRIIVKGFGATQPISDNTSEEGRQKNRRVEMIIIEK